MFSIRNHVVIFFFGFDKYAQNQIRPIYILCHIYIVYYSLRSSIQNYKNCTRNKTQRIKKQYKSNFLLFDLYKYFLYQFNFLYLFIFMYKYLLTQNFKIFGRVYIKKLWYIARSENICFLSFFNFSQKIYKNWTKYIEHLYVLRRMS